MYSLLHLVGPLGAPQLATEAAACDAFVAVRWPTGIISCPHCGNPCERNLAHLRCTGVRRHKATIFFGTPLGTKLKPNVRATLLALRAMTTTPRSISARELAREVGMNHVTLWRHMHSLRASLLPNGIAHPTKRVVEQTIATWLNGTFHGISRAWQHRYRQEIGARWYLDATTLLMLIGDAFLFGARAITLKMARSRRLHRWREPPPLPSRRETARADIHPATHDMA